MKVIGATGFDSLTVQSKSGEYFDAPISALIEEATEKAPPTITVDAKRLEKVEAYRRAFGSLLAKNRSTRKEVCEAGKELGISVSAAYAALKRYAESGEITQLPPPTRPGGRGKSRLLPAVEQVIQDEIEKTLLKRRNYGISKFIENVEKRLRKLGLDVSEATLRNRVAAIPDYKWTKARKGYDETAKTHEPLKGKHPEAAQPLEIIQCDHWYSDMEILSEDRLDVIGRAWMTIAIDVFSRAIWGLHIGLDSPSTTTMALCMINGMTRKDAMLKSYGIDAHMPIYGDPKRLHLDNAGEFTGNSIKMSCDHFNIKLSWRPVRKPQYGAYIERYNGNLAQKFKDLPGATGSNPGERKALRPEKTAAFTLEDLTKQTWMLINEYHNTEHLGLDGKKPIDKWTEYFFGPNGQRRPTPPVRIDNLELRINWYPLEKRTIQRYGILIDYLEYYSETILFLVRNKKDYGKIAVRRNPLDVREIYILHPVTNEWSVVPTRHLTFPVASIFELKAAKKIAHAMKRKPTSDLLAQIIDERRRHVEEAQKLTKTARREASRRAHHTRMRKAAAPQSPQNDEITILAGAPNPKPQADAAQFTPPKNLQQNNGFNDQSQDLSALLNSITDDDIEDYLNDSN
ncbi:Mu transposase C-terminal domain-containing protein [Rhodoblastus sp.]|jgi:putative transposase|uniref:Mu transposase C-terminal domain-containing protein n=1 Tax=Rhodoblastus sp. TaxID=1962975 RepID=UPI0026001EB5|nr:Mu transposase C-terminal domain-containing protein [Rhodoblastus sp.]